MRADRFRFCDVKARFDGGNKWIQGDWQDPQGNMCLIGNLADLMFQDYSLEFQSEKLFNSDPQIQMFARLIRENYPERMAAGCACVSCVETSRHRRPSVDILAFNDHEDTTWEDVERMLEKMIAMADEIV